MIDIETLKAEIIERLKPLKPEKIILFGSYAYGTPAEESDIVSSAELKSALFCKIFYLL